jgi:glycosyltransferase involved in cell wall biosynthesis
MSEIAPLISIVVPSLNQAEFLDACLNSIFSQQNAIFEVLLCDGGSCDGSDVIIRKYQQHLTYWRSHPDKGQADALNEGFSRARGSVLFWVNSDDLLEPNALSRISNTYKRGDVIYAGIVRNFDKNGIVRSVRQTALMEKTILKPWKPNREWHMPGVAFNREVWEKYGQLSQSYRYLFDAKFIAEALDHSEVIYLPHEIAAFRLHANSKTVSELRGFYIEGWRLFREKYERFGLFDQLRGCTYHFPRFLIGILWRLKNTRK